MQTTLFTGSGDNEPEQHPKSPKPKKDKTQKDGQHKTKPRKNEAHEPEQDKPAQGDGWPSMAEMLHNVVMYEPTEHTLHPVKVLGISAESEDICGADRMLLEKADVICAGRSLLTAIASALPASAGDTGVDDERFLPLTVPVTPTIQHIESLRAAGKRVLVLANGDPLYFGIGTTLIRALGADAVHIVPAVSILQLICARLGLAWPSVANISLHGRDNFGPLNVNAGRGVPVCVLTDEAHSPDTLARHLLDRGADWFEAHIYENFGTSLEREYHVSLAEAAALHFEAMCTVLLVPIAPVRKPCLGLAEDDLAIEGGVVTKAAVRAAALSLLRLQPHHAVWDIGAGSGAVSLEACALAHAGSVTAIEHNVVRTVCANENRRRFGATILEICEGHAPECLPPLPNPDRVFIGGGLSGEDGVDILSHVWERLPAGGRIVATCVLLGTLEKCRGFFESRACETQIVELQASATSPLGRDVHLTAQNPVFMVSAQK